MLKESVPTKVKGESEGEKGLNPDVARYH